jgi:hypothetical protein
MSGIEVGVWTNRDTSSGGFERIDQGERAATAKHRRRKMRKIIASARVSLDGVFEKVKRSSAAPLTP